VNRRVELWIDGKFHGEFSGARGAARQLINLEQDGNVEASDVRIVDKEIAMAERAAKKP
jgi:hypothetical protein